MTNSTRPKWYMAAAIVALVWNLLGVLAYLGQAMMPPEAYELMSEAEQALYESRPSWVMGSFAIGVWGGLLASIFLMMKKSISYLLFLVSLIGVVGQQSWMYFVSNSIEVYGSSALFMSLTVLIASIWLVWFSKKAKTNGWTT